MKFGWIFLLLAALTAGPTAAQDSRIAVVDLRKAIGAHPGAKALEAELQTKGGNANSVINAKREELAKIGQQGQELQKNPLSRGLNGDLLPDVIAQLTELRKQAAELERKILEVRAGTQAELGKDRLTGLAEIAEQIQAVIRDVNGGRFDLVFDKSAVSRDGLPQLLDYPNAIDITDDVIAKYQVKTPTPAKP